MTIIALYDAEASRTKTIRLGIKEHFSKEELILLPAKTSYSSYHRLRKFPIDYFEDPTFLGSKNRKILPYARKLGLYCRIRLPFEMTLKMDLTIKDIDQDKHPFLKEFTEVFEQFYPVIDRINANNQSKKYKLLTTLTILVFRLWLAGYSIHPTTYREVLRVEIIQQTLDTVSISQKVYVRKLARILELDPLCPILKAPLTVVHSSLVEKEKLNWEIEFDQRKVLPIVSLFKEYVFGELLLRIKGTHIREFIKKDNILTRKSLSKLQPSTWWNYARQLRAYLHYCIKQKATDFNSIPDNTAITFLNTEWSNRSFGERNSFRVVYRGFLNWLNDLYQTGININKMLPYRIGRSMRTYGKILDLTAANILIQNLLDNQNPYINENKLNDFRCRRVCLIQLATGARVNSICLLLTNSLKMSKEGTYWLHLHRTKGNKDYHVEVGPEVVNWINELKQFSPNKKIFASSESLHSGDDLEEHRLVANVYDDGPLASGAINKFLRNLQDNIWPDTHPNINKFTSHDLRRMQAIYMVLKGKSREQIQDKLKQTNPNSVIPYVATSPPEYQNWYAQILKEGVWKDVISDGDEEQIVGLKIIMDQASKIQDNVNMESFIKQLIEVAEQESKEIGLNNGSFIPISEVSAGFPKKTHNCTAHALLNCGHTEIHCFGCSHYKADDHMLLEHKAEILRFMLLSLRHKKMQKQYKNSFDQKIITLKTEDINKQIEEAIPNIFEKNYNFEKSTTKKIQDNLWKLAKQYIKNTNDYSKAISFQEALDIVTGGDINVT